MKNNSESGIIPRKRISYNLIQKGCSYLLKHGIKATIKKIIGQEVYQEWINEHSLSEQELQEQRTTSFEKNPKISIVVPLYNTNIWMLNEMINSVVCQTYSNWELCLVNASANNERINSTVEEWIQKNSRIKFKKLDNNLGISGNTNEAISIASGEWIAFLDHDDTISPNALYEMVSSFNIEENDVYYSDEDKLLEDGSKRVIPHFKPDFSPDLLYSVNYITHFTIVRKSIIDEIGGLSSNYDGAQDYDLLLKIYEKTVKFKHISKVLYHWRISSSSTASNPESKQYTIESGRRALQDHLNRIGVKAKVESLPAPYLNSYHVIYEIIDQPLVSIIIPNKDQVKYLQKCINSILQKNSYKNYEILIVENNSKTKEIFEYYEEIQNKYKNIRVIVYEGEFNFSKINNFAVKSAKGEYLLFLNNDTELIQEDGIQELIGVCQRKDVAVVGARLLYEDDSIQHAGVIVGISKSAAHVFLGLKKHQSSYMHRAVLNVNYSAVTAACMMVKKELFDMVNGFSEDFKIAFNDIDFCLKVREKTGKLVVYNGQSTWHHFESKSRGYEDTPEKKKRFEEERQRLISNWPHYFEKGDPYYNPAFDLSMAPWQL